MKLISNRGWAELGAIASQPASTPVPHQDYNFEMRHLIDVLTMLLIVIGLGAGDLSGEKTRTSAVDAADFAAGQHCRHVAAINLALA